MAVVADMAVALLAAANPERLVVLSGRRLNASCLVSLCLSVTMLCFESKILLVLFYFLFVFFFFFSALGCIFLFSVQPFM